jgi:hypothetical protein
MEIYDVRLFGEATNGLFMSSFGEFPFFQKSSFLRIYFSIADPNVEIQKNHALL